MTEESTVTPLKPEDVDKMDLETLRKEVLRLSEQNAFLFEEKVRLSEEVETLQSRCQKLARAASAQTPSDDIVRRVSTVSGGAVVSMVDGRETHISPMISQMLKSPMDEAIQIEGIDKLFAEQTQSSDTNGSSSASNQVALEVAVAIFRNHPANQQLLLKAAQFLSVLLQERGVQQQLPVSALFEAAQAVVRMGDQILQSGPQNSPKLLTWFLTLLAYILPCLDSTLRDETQSRDFVMSLINELITNFLAAADASMLKSVLKCVELLPLLPPEPWIQKACVDSGAAHSVALSRKRCSSGEGNLQSDASAKFQAALLHIFSENPELCVRAIGDEFVTDEYVCLLILNELGKWEQKQRRSFRTLDEKWGVVEKALELWSAHQRILMESADPQACGSREVLQKVAELLMKVLAKLTPQRLLQRFQLSVNEEVSASEPLQRLILATTQANPQLRLQLAVNYENNNVGHFVTTTLTKLLHRFESDADPKDGGADVEATFQLLQDDKLPAEGWAYLEYGLEICQHILAHWSAAKLAHRGAESNELQAQAAPVVLAQGGLVDVLAELIDPKASGIELVKKPPKALHERAEDTLQLLFEQSAHVCLFCMSHYSEVKTVISLGAASLAHDPLADNFDRQKQAVEQLATAFEKFADDDKLCRKILKALENLFESSHRLAAWFLKEYPLSRLGELQAVDVHIEACKSIPKVPYWSIEDVDELPGFINLISGVLVECIEAEEAQGKAPAASRAQRRKLDLNESEELVTHCMTSLLHLLLIDPSPPTVLRCLASSLARGERKDDENGSEAAVNSVMKIMQVFPSSDRVQMHCQHLLTSLLGE